MPIRHTCRQPLDSDTPPVLGSRLLSVPSFRPGRRLRQSSLDPHPSVSYGDPIIQKAPGSIRLIHQNVKGLTYSQTKEDYNYYFQCIQGFDVDIFGLSETNTCWSHHHLAADFRSTLQRYGRQSKSVFGQISPEVDACLQKEYFQSGGNVTCALGPIVSRIAGTDIIDPTGLGRWSGFTIEGPENRKLSIITAYRVCSGSPQTAPIGSAFLREYEYFRERHHTSANPRRIFLFDLHQVIQNLQDQGHSILLMLDANSTLDDTSFSDFIAKSGLQDLHLGDPAPSTYIGSANRRIDFILGCEEAAKYVCRSGSLAYTQGPQSDHRCLYIDLSSDFIHTPSWQSILPSKSRDLHTGNPDMVESYHTKMLQYYAHHNMADRIQRLFDGKDTLTRDELRDALIKWDNDQGRAMEHSEKHLRRPPQKCDWSPTLRNSALIRRYWVLRLRETTRSSDYTATFHRWQKSVQLSDPDFSFPLLGQQLSTEQIRVHLNKADRDFRSVQRRSIPIRLRTNQELLDTYKDDHDPATRSESLRKAKILQHTISGEHVRNVFSNLRQVVRPTESSSLSKLIVPIPPTDALDSSTPYQLLQATPTPDILWETVVNREEIERQLLQYNRESFRAAAESPCGHGVIYDALTFTSLSPSSEQLLAGTVPTEWGADNDNYLKEFLASFAIPDKVHQQQILTSISEDDIKHGFKGWKESTSTSPSGRHLGHYKALIQHPTLLRCFTQFMNIVVSRGIAIPRWCHATNVMIEKDPGQPKIHRLRIIHLFEADYNFFLKLQWSHRLVRQALSLDLLHDSQHGSIPSRTAMDPIMLNQLTSDLCRILKHNLARFDNDASACYDRIIVALGMLAARRCGMPKNAIRLHSEALQFMKYTVKTMYGISEDTYSGTAFEPLFGTGQGSGASPAVWLSLVVLLLHSLDRIVPHRMNFAPISGARVHSRSSDAFVDDTSVGFTSTNDDTSYSDLIVQLQEVAQTWEKLLSLSGGKLNLTKCSWYVLFWEWQNGRPCLRRISPADPTLSLTQGTSTTTVPIQQHPPEHSSRMLGVYLNPLGDFTDHLLILKKKADDFARRILSPRLSETDVSIFHRSIYIPSMRYSLAAIAADEESLASVQSRVVKSILQKLHISSTIPTSLRHGPPELGGLGLYDLRTESGLEAIKFLRNSLYSDSEAGNLIRINLQYSQREAGVGFYLLEQPQKFISYLTPSWILSIRQYLANTNMSITVSDIHMDSLQGRNDDYIMNPNHMSRYSVSQQRDLNLVRMWLQVSTLSEMTDPAQPNRILTHYLDATRPNNFQLSTTWPRQSLPTKSQARLWKRFLVSSYLRYIPFWKSPPVDTSTRQSDPPPVPTSMHSHLEYISTFYSRTERRLLSGLEQVAADISIWRAFRSKKKLSLASDGGLGDNSATLGWVLSSDKEILFQCSGPVDGPFDTNSSTRSELGGYASSLLLISALSSLWGIRHRCSFRWYTDSTSAISRVNRFCGRRRPHRMPHDVDLLSIIKTCLQRIRRSFRPIWVRAHQDDTMPYDKLPFAARLNIDADFLATRYRQHGRLRAIKRIDHRPEQQVSIYINGIPLTSQYDECIRFHVNGYHHRNYVQHHNAWSNATWDTIDFYSFGRHFKRLSPSHRVQHFKFIHDQLPLGDRRLRESILKDTTLQLCPCCREHEETTSHLMTCRSNSAYQSSFMQLRSDLLTKDVHPVRYLLSDGIGHYMQHGDLVPFTPLVHQYSPHFHDVISSALAEQAEIGWLNALKGYLSKQWGAMAQYNMHSTARDSRTGELRMSQVMSSLSSHARRLWLSRNASLHNATDSNLDQIRSAETVEIRYYHSRPHLLRTGDQHYCRRSLDRILAAHPATRRRWLRKVKQSSAELTKDGTNQTLVTNFFRPL